MFFPPRESLFLSQLPTRFDPSTPSPPYFFACVASFARAAASVQRTVESRAVTRAHTLLALFGKGGRIESRQGVQNTINRSLNQVVRGPIVLTNNSCPPFDRMFDD